MLQCLYTAFNVYLVFDWVRIWVSGIKVSWLLCIHIHTGTLHLNSCIYVYSVDIYIYTCACAYIYILYMYMCIYICMYVYIHFLHVHLNRSLHPYTDRVSRRQSWLQLRAITSYIIHSKNFVVFCRIKSNGITARHMLRPIGAYYPLPLALLRIKLCTVWYPRKCVFVWVKHDRFLLRFVKFPGIWEMANW